MNRKVLVIPSSPALVEELAPADAPSRELLAAARDILAPLDPATIDVVGSLDERWRTSVTGSFQAWGAPGVTVGGGNCLAELIARYVLGERLEARIDDVRERLGQPQAELTVVVTDGSAGLTQRAPLALIDGAEATDRWCREVLSGHSVAAMTPAQLQETGIIDVALWEDLANVDKRDATLVAGDTATGVGRYVACWEAA